MHREVKIQAVQPVLILVVDVLAMVNDKQIAGPFFYHAILSFCMRRYEKKTSPPNGEPDFFSSLTRLEPELLKTVLCLSAVPVLCHL